MGPNSTQHASAQCQIPEPRGTQIYNNVSELRAAIETVTLEPSKKMLKLIEKNPEVYLHQRPRETRLTLHVVCVDDQCVFDQSRRNAPRAILGPGSPCIRCVVHSLFDRSFIVANRVSSNKHIIFELPLPAPIKVRSERSFYLLTH